VIGLGDGPWGVAAGFSLTTPITALDILKVLLRPFLSILVAAAVTLAAWNFVGVLPHPPVRLILGNVIFFVIYILLLCFVMGQKDFYANLIREIGLWSRTPARARRESLLHLDA
jgi:hypothetical protein